MRKWIPLSPTVPIETPHGYGIAWFLIDQGEEKNVQWFVCINDGPHTGQFWVVDNSEVRACRNWTVKRKLADPVIPRK